MAGSSRNYGKCPECGRVVASAALDGVLTGSVRVGRHKPEPGALEWCEGEGSVADLIPPQQVPGG